MLYSVGESGDQSWRFDLGTENVNGVLDVPFERVVRGRLEIGE